jgi:hypothetical protein
MRHSHRQILADFGQHIGGFVVGRNYLDSQVRRLGPESLPSVRHRNHAQIEDTVTRLTGDSNTQLGQYPEAAFAALNESGRD